MNKKPLFVIFIALILLAVFGVLSFVIREQQSEEEKESAAAFDPLNATYNIEGQPVTLVNGKSEVEAAPGSAIKIQTMIFGEPTIGDINNDGRPDAAFIIVQNPGGTGTFYYIAAVINTPTGAIGTNGILLGDRIAPQTVEITKGRIIANYADRKPDEPFSTPPSIGISKYIKFNGSQLEEVKI